MIHSQVYGYFKECLPEIATNTKEYFSNGKNSIRVRQNNGQDFVFTFNDLKSWKFETIELFISGMKGAKKHG